MLIRVNSYPIPVSPYNRPVVSADLKEFNESSTFLMISSLGLQTESVRIWRPHGEESSHGDDFESWPCGTLVTKVSAENLIQIPLHHVCRCLFAFLAPPLLSHFIEKTMGITGTPLTVGISTSCSLGFMLFGQLVELFVQAMRR